MTSREYLNSLKREEARRRRTDPVPVKEMLNAMAETARLKGDMFTGYTYYGQQSVRGNGLLPRIEKVIFRNPATIVFWADGTKTVVKVQGKDHFNKEKGLAMAISKKALGNNGRYYNEYKKWL